MTTSESVSNDGTYLQGKNVGLALDLLLCCCSRDERALLRGNKEGSRDY